MGLRTGKSVLARAVATIYKEDCWGGGIPNLEYQQGQMWSEGH